MDALGKKFRGCWQQEQAAKQVNRRVVIRFTNHGLRVTNHAHETPLGDRAG